MLQGPKELRERMCNHCGYGADDGASISSQNLDKAFAVPKVEAIASLILPQPRQERGAPAEQPER